ncbi:hypothetical protein C2G38_2164690 [Gigaspora rosea]|uniref:Uncharacterized protein n=1 Tax=Gigaspora rosea TaxID=44941 RepID=A0A397VW14_9GLOM|nr:hypothetical protein C2G38_2164690 [Gigaspora rosea]
MDNFNQSEHYNSNQNKDGNSKQSEDSNYDQNKYDINQDIEEKPILKIKLIKTNESNEKLMDSLFKRQVEKGVSGDIYDGKV